MLTLDCLIEWPTMITFYARDDQFVLLAQCYHRSVRWHNGWLRGLLVLCNQSIGIVGLLGPAHLMILGFFPAIAAGPASKTVERGFQEYLNYSELCDDPLKFWSYHAVLFPGLFKLPKRTLIAPASMVYAECVFSKAGIILSNRWLRCSNKCFESQLVGNMNKRAFDTPALREATGWFQFVFD